jgi:phosphoglycerate kinase
MNNLNNIINFNFKKRNVVLRVDYNVPLKNKEIKDTIRIDKTMETINFLFKKDINNLIIISHLGRPGGKIVPDLTLMPIFNYLKSYIPSLKFLNLDECLNNISDYHKKVILLENIRFYPEEERKSDNDKIDIFEKKLAKLGEIFVNDAFGTSHRNHCSVIGKYFKFKFHGFLIKKELSKLKSLKDNIKRPFTCILGGAKVSDKIKLIYNLLDKVDNILIGGGMAFTFLKIRDNINIGSSLYDSDSEAEVKKILLKAQEKNVKIYLPVDFMTSDKISDQANISYSTLKDGIRDGYMGLDVGMLTTINFGKIIINSKTILWNGPMGVFELEKFSTGSRMISDSLVKLSEQQVLSSEIIIAGGDTIFCFKKNCFCAPFIYLSTGGGSTLKYLEGSKMPGIDKISNYKNEL